MTSNLGAILLVIYVFATIIAGIIFGNRSLAEKEGSTILGIYFIWFVIKQAVISFILFVIALFIVEAIFKKEIFDYLLLIIYGVLNFLYARNTVFSEYRIMFKPGEGILTPEGRAKLEKYSRSVEKTGNKSNNETTSTKSCPFEGRILVQKETKVLGFDWSTSDTAFQISNDWKVSTPNDSSYGWIDVDGEIHKGLPLGGDVDPTNILAFGATGLAISGSYLYHSNEKIGELVKW